MQPTLTSRLGYLPFEILEHIASFLTPYEITQFLIYLSKTDDFDYFKFLNTYPHLNFFHTNPTIMERIRFTFKNLQLPPALPAPAPPQIILQRMIILIGRNNLDLSSFVISNLTSCISYKNVIDLANKGDLNAKVILVLSAGTEEIQGWNIKDPGIDYYKKVQYIMDLSRTSFSWVKKNFPNNTDSYKFIQTLEKNFYPKHIILSVLDSLRGMIGFEILELNFSIKNEPRHIRNLPFVDFTSLNSIDWSGCFIKYHNFRCAKFPMDTNLSECIIAKTDFICAQFKNNLNLSSSKIYRSSLTAIATGNCNLSNAFIEKTLLTAASMVSAQFAGTSFTDVEISLELCVAYELQNKKGLNIMPDSSPLPDQVM